MQHSANICLSDHAPSRPLRTTRLRASCSPPAAAASPPQGATPPWEAASGRRPVESSRRPVTTIRRPVTTDSRPGIATSPQGSAFRTMNQIENVAFPFLMQQNILQLYPSAQASLLFLEAQKTGKVPRYRREEGKNSCSAVAVVRAATSSMLT